MEPKYLRRATATASAPDDPLYANHQADYFDLVHLPSAWDVNAGSDDLTLAIVDSGASLDHADLAGRDRGLGVLRPQVYAPTPGDQLWVRDTTPLTVPSGPARGSTRRCDLPDPSSGTW